MLPGLWLFVVKDHSVYHQEFGERSLLLYVQK